MGKIKELPYDLIAERQLLSIILTDSTAIDEIVGIIKAEMFFDHRHRLIYDEMLGLYEKNIPIELTSVANRLDTKRVSLYQIHDIATEFAVEANIHVYIDVIVKKYIARQTILLCRDTAVQCYETPEPEIELEKLDNRLVELVSNSQRGEFVSLQSIMDEFQEIINMRQDRTINSNSFKTGFETFDKIGSIVPGRMYIISAKSKHGKSTFAIQLAVNLSRINDIGVGFITLEMTKFDQLEKIACSMAGVDSWRLQNGYLKREEHDRVNEKISELRELKLFINDTPGLSVSDVKASVRLLKRKHDIKVVFIDYVQIMRAPNAQTRQQSLAKLSNDLVTLARDLEIAIVLMSQVNADYVTREAGDLENDASMVIKIRRPEQDRNEEMDVNGHSSVKDTYKVWINGVEEDVPVEGLVFFSIARNRFGKAGKSIMYFDGETQTFYDYGKQPDWK